MGNRKITAQTVKSVIPLGYQLPAAYTNSSGTKTNDRLTAAEVYINLYNITALTGGAAGALDSLRTQELVDLLVNDLGSPDYGPMFHCHFEVGGNVVDLYYRFLKAADAENSPYAIRPDDFGSQATNYIYRLAAPPVHNGVLLINDNSDVTTWYELTAPSGGGSTSVGTTAITIA